MDSLNYIGLLTGLVLTVLLITGLTFGFRQMKVRYSPAWAVCCAALLGTLMAFSGGGRIIVALMLFGVPLLGGVIYLIGKSDSRKQTAVFVAVVLFASGILFLTFQGHETAALSEAQVRQRTRMMDNVMEKQAAVARQLRDEYARQRRELFNRQLTESETAGGNDDQSSSIVSQTETLKSSVGVAWYPEVDEQFDADVHPSMSAAGHMLGRKLAGLMEHSSEAESDPPIIQISASSTIIHDDSQEALNELATVIRSRFPEAQVLVDHLTPSKSVTLLDPQAVSIRLNMTVAQTTTPAPWDASKIERTIDLVAELRGQTDKVSTSVRMIDKPWVQEFDEFVNSNRGDGILITGRSGRLALKRTEAWNAAIDDAVSMLTPMTAEVLKARKTVFVRNPSEEEIADRLRKELLAGQLIEDSFLQQLAHPMGNLWREAVLVRVDYPWLEKVFSDYFHQRQKEELSRLSLAAALILLAVGVVILHAFLNWITRGYHQKSVGALSIMLALAGVLTLIVTAMSLGLPGSA